MAAVASGVLGAVALGVFALPLPLLPESLAGVGGLALAFASTAGPLPPPGAWQSAFW